MRLRADQRRCNGRRAAICKAVLVRELRLAGPTQKEDYLVSLDPHEANPATASADCSPCWRTCSAAPSAATSTPPSATATTARPRPRRPRSFPMLIRNANHHLAACARAAKAGSPTRSSGRSAASWTALGATFPRNLRLEDQGRFAIGYYHERFSRASALPDARGDATDITDATAED